MPDEPIERSTRRWLTAGEVVPNGRTKLLAAALFLGCFALFYGPLGFRGMGLIWVPALGAVVLSIPLYALLRGGDRILNRWWERRRPSSRLRLRRIGWTTYSLAFTGFGVWLARTDGIGFALIALGAYFAFRAVTEKRRGV